MSASIIYRAEYGNLTSETWSDANIKFSTSQTTITSLEDSKAPSMDAWPIKISTSFFSLEGNLQSNQEKAQKSAYPFGSRNQTSTREDLFGIKPLQKSNIRGEIYTNSYDAFKASQIGGLFGASQQQNGSGLFWSQQQQNELGARSTSERSHKVAPSGQTSTSTNMPQSDGPESISYIQESQKTDSIESKLGETGRDLLFEETSYEEACLTSIYEVSGVRTLEPLSMKRQYYIATLQTPIQALYQIAVPKSQKVTYLYAKLRNPSSQSTILKGVAGVTLDNSFLGTIRIDRVGPNQDFKIPLGADPSVRIGYPKPTTQRRVLVMLDKSIVAESRSIRVENNKTRPVTIKVLDQVPKSENVDLEIKIVEPQPLIKKGDSVETGNDATQAESNVLRAEDNGKNVQTPWGKATATLKQDGQIMWDCVIESGKTCSLDLSYEVWLPLNSYIANCWDFYCILLLHVSIVKEYSGSYM